jgi:hypothetical protein
MRHNVDRKVKSFMASSIGRNDPCHCGSGHKYKKCCAMQAPSQVTGGSLSDEVAAYTLRLTRGADLQAAWEEFGETGSVKRPDRDRFGHFMDWLIIGRRQNGRTILQRFEAERGASLSGEHRAELEKHKATNTGVYEVIALRPGTGLTVKNIFSGEEVEVADVSASRGASVWDVLMMRLRRMGGPAQAWGEVIIFSPLDRAELQFELEAAHRMAKVHEPELDLQSFLNSAPPLLRKLQAGFSAKRKPSFSVSTQPLGANPQSVLAAAMTEHNKSWPDTPVKALGGRTPREAAADAQGRIHLGDLLKEYERNQTRMPAEAGIGRLMNVPAIIWMREALGQPIPEALAELHRRFIAATTGASPSVTE